MSGSLVGRALRPAFVLAATLIVVLSAVAPTSASAHVGDGTYGVRTTDLAAAAHTFIGSYLSCPKGQRVVSGGASWHRAGEGPVIGSQGGRLTASTPTTDGKGWYASGYNNSNEALRLRVVALCLPKDLVGTYTLRTLDLAAAAGTPAGDDLSCPSGKRVVAGGAFWHRPGEAPDLSLLGLLVSSTASSDGKGWFAAGLNGTGDALRLKVVVLCVPEARVGGYTLRTTDLTAASGDTVGDHLSCPKGKRVVTGGAYWHQLGGGPDVSDTMRLASSTATTDGKGWYASGRSQAPSSKVLTLSVLCVKPR